MRGVRRLVVGAAVSGLLAAGAVGLSVGTAHAAFSDLCGGNSTTSPAWTCEVTGTIPAPASITVNVTDATANAAEEVVVNWTVRCADGSSTAQTAGAPTVGTPVALNLTLPNTAGGQCQVTATVSLPQSELSTTNFTPTPFNVQLDYTPANPAPTASATSTSPASSSVHPVKGYGGICVDDKGNSSANGAAAIIWGCSGSDQAQNWSFSSNELQHNGKCLNDKANGGNRSKVILYSCNGGSNEKWSELANGELKLQAHNGTLCLNDPGYSTKNGTQLIVYTCTDSANEKWSLP
jgi:hypothetical protein